MIWIGWLLACGLDGALIDRTEALDPAACLDAATVGEVIDVAPDEPLLQIHPSVVFDGDGLTVSWCGRGAGSGFAMFTRTIGCDGTLGEVIEVDTGDASQCDGPLASTGEATLLAWQRERPDDSGDFDVPYRLRTSDGWGEVAITPLEHPGDGVVRSAWLPDAARMGVEDFVVVGSWAHDLSTGFQVFASRIGPDGSSIETVELDPVADRSQTYPSATSDEEGDVWVAWVDETVSSSSRIMAARWPADGSPPETPIAFVPGDAVAPSVAAGNNVWVAGVRDGDVVLVSLDGLEVIVDSGAGDYAPTLVAGPPGITGLAWLSGTDGALHFRTFDDAGDVLTEQVVTEGPIGPYPLHLEHVGEAVFALAWPAGNTPDFAVQTALLE